ncbi:uncharacterized protein L969DRAFT_88567 [Mixia osmundae IAM 14324]|uniref:Ubiquinol-cytochrome C reductase hinge domain-containing protein n=1 Tax=Mixia osmundae (strain CBS 9802 / IAM 14324 / JCM 22182 / KY 12970) TaxID=764103 RepID=G7E6P5_MIXOS|nr:uncharacterized protein L969DRAFT_88567 [Mixia osmundae IAM 14324]KEI39113.1 hypothetical protein L969DRAFT_88567 [Mixia osmundae IAM 14324]GAA98505.1 hypothetical protein E5Q_05191 [Mixia osmundae IAM 14324]
MAGKEESWLSSFFGSASQLLSSSQDQQDTPALPDADTLPSDFSSISTGWSRMTSIRCDDGEDEDPKPSADEGEEAEGGGEGGEAEEEEEEEEEPVDPADEIKEKCKSSSQCKAAKHHFEECQERVEAGKGFKGENCVEELFHLLHCVDECAAPKIFASMK